MGKKSFHLAGKAYTVKAEIKATVRHIVANARLDSPLTGEPLQFMRDLFSYHPRADLKIGEGIEVVVVRIASRNPKNREFWLKQVGRDEFIDISWTECVNATSALSEFRNACRLAVKADTQAFADSQFTGRTILRCPLNRSQFNRSQAHVDHDDPWPFSKIVEAFIAQEGVDVETVEYDGFEHGSTHITFSDPALAARFARFHAKTARLRMVSASGNLARG